MNKNKNYITRIWALIALVVCIFVSCEEDKDYNTKQDNMLNAFGPCPALRGGELTLTGTGIDKVTKVILPENIAVTSITVVSGDKIKIIIPQEAKPGYITLEYANGSKVTSKTMLSFTEPIEIESIEPNPVKAGQKLTVKGDYLNLINVVIFAEGDSVFEFIAHDRNKIEVILPETAQTGVVEFRNTGTTNAASSSFELVVVLPSVDEVAELVGPKPGDVITLQGKDLDLVKKVLTPRLAEMDFSVSSDSKSITFTLPDDITDGIIQMVPASGVKVPLADLEMALPEKLVATPAGNLRPGDIIAIKGENLRLVIEAQFAGSSSAAVITSLSDTELKVIMPEDAVSGDITLTTASGKTAKVGIVTAKPQAQSYSPTTVAAGAELTINGVNLDLIASLTFTGGVTANVSTTDASVLKVAVPTVAETGAITAKMKNGETVAFPSLTVDKPQTAFIPSMPGEDILPGKLWIVTIANFDKLTGVQINGKTVQFVLNGDKLYVGIPGELVGDAVLKLISSNGEIEYNIFIKPVETVIWTGPVEITSWSNQIYLSLNSFNDVKAGTYMKIYFTQKEAWGQVQINNGKWQELRFDDIGGAYLKTDMYNDKSVTSQELKLTQSVLDNIRANADWGNAIIFQGENWIFDKITLFTKD